MQRPERRLHQERGAEPGEEPEVHTRVEAQPPDRGKVERGLRQLLPGQHPDHDQRAEHGQRADHGEEEKLERSPRTARAAPEKYDQVHGDEHELVADEEEEQVAAEKDAVERGLHEEEQSVEERRVLRIVPQCGAHGQQEGEGREPEHQVAERVHGEMHVRVPLRDPGDVEHRHRAVRQQKTEQGRQRGRERGRGQGESAHGLVPTMRERAAARGRDRQRGDDESQLRDEVHGSTAQNMSASASAM